MSPESSGEDDIDERAGARAGFDTGATDDVSAEEFVRRWVPVEFFTEGASQALEDEMAGVVSAFHPLGFRLMARSLAETDTTKLLPKIDVPTLLLWGDSDRRSPLSIASQLRNAVPNAELAVIANAGHVSNMEQPEVFSAHVRRFCLATLAA